MSATETRPGLTHEQWALANRDYLDRELERFRLLLRRRILWLRRHWNPGPVSDLQPLAITDAQADRALLGEDRRAELHFHHDDPEAAHITSAIAQAERELASLRDEHAGAGAPPPIEVLARLFGLNAFERDLLLLCLAAEIDPAFERLFAYVQDDATRRYVTPQLALQLLTPPEDAGAAAHALQPHANLRRLRLVHWDAGPPQEGGVRLRLADRISAFLRGFNSLDPRASALLVPLRGAPLAGAYRDTLEGLERWVASCPRTGVSPAINLVGPDGAGKHALAFALCTGAGLTLLELDPRKLPATFPEREEIYRVIEREAFLMGAAVYVEAAASEDFGDLPEKLNVFLIAATREPFRGRRDMLTVHVEKPDMAGQRALWEQSLPAGWPAADTERLVQQFDLGPSAIAAAVADSRSRVRMRVTPGDPGEIAFADVWQSCTDRAGSLPDGLAQRIRPAYEWADIVLPEDVASQLHEIADQVTHRALVYAGWGFGEKLSRGRGINALFSGPSGTGKTMAAEILANHLHLDLYRIDLAGVVSKYIGETEKNLRRVFDAAEQSGALLFFDEADALFGRRSEVKDSHDRFANIEINYLLQRMEDYRGIAILATNMKSQLDQAFLRRLRFLVEIPFPDFEDRRRIWERVFPPGAPLGELHYDELARLEIPGGNIHNIALNAAFLAATEEAPIGMAHVMRSAIREYTKIEKLITSADFGGWYERVKP